MAAGGISELVFDCCSLPLVVDIDLREDQVRRDESDMMRGSSVVEMC
jgi:hypothetical protein